VCHVFSRQDPASYAYHTRSIRLGGHSTSIRLEAAFWTILDEIAATQGVSLAKFLTILHDEVLENVEKDTNFTSLLRCACLAYVSEVRGRPEAEASLRLAAEKDFGEYFGTRQAALL
jgi:predicted DNA-binding ribbon-helix-helix protein